MCTYPNIQKIFAHVQLVAVDSDCDFHVALSVAAYIDDERRQAVCDVRALAVD